MSNINYLRFLHPIGKVMTNEQSLKETTTSLSSGRLMLITSDMPTTVPTEQFLKSLPKHMLDSDPPPPQQPQPQYNNTNPNPPGYHKRLNKVKSSHSSIISRIQIPQPFSTETAMETAATPVAVVAFLHRLFVNNRCSSSNNNTTLSMPTCCHW